MLEHRLDSPPQFVSTQSTLAPDDQPWMHIHIEESMKSRAFVVPELMHRMRPWVGFSARLWPRFGAARSGSGRRPRVFRSELQCSAGCCRCKCLFFLGWSCIGSCAPKVWWKRPPVLSLSAPAQRISLCSFSLRQDLRTAHGRASSSLSRRPNHDCRSAASTRQTLSVCHRCPGCIGPCGRIEACCLIQSQRERNSRWGPNSGLNRPESLRSLEKL
jgi:hypothetical protein